MPPRAKAALSHISETLKRQLTKIRNAAKHQYFKHVTMKKYKPPTSSQSGMYGLSHLDKSETIKRHAYQRRIPTKAGHTGRPAHPEYIGELAKRQLQRYKTDEAIKQDRIKKAHTENLAFNSRLAVLKDIEPRGNVRRPHVPKPLPQRRTKPAQGPRHTEAQVPIHAPSGTFSDMGPSSSRLEPEEEEQGFYTAPSSPTHSPVVQRKKKKDSMVRFLEGMTEDQRDRYFKRTLPMHHKRMMTDDSSLHVYQ